MLLSFKQCVQIATLSSCFIGQSLIGQETFASKNMFDFMINQLCFLEDTRITYALAPVNKYFYARIIETKPTRKAMLDAITQKDPCVCMCLEFQRDIATPLVFFGSYGSVCVYFTKSGSSPDVLAKKFALQMNWLYLENNEIKKASIKAPLAHIDGNWQFGYRYDDEKKNWKVCHGIAAYGVGSRIEGLYWDDKSENFYCYFRQYTSPNYDHPFEILMPKQSIEHPVVASKSS